MDTPPPLPVTDEAKWPLKSLLIFGYFGAKSPEGRLFHNRCISAFVMMLVAFVPWPSLRQHFQLDSIDHQADRIVMNVLLGVTFSFVAWSFWKYLSELDELTRGMQLQAICLTYVTGMGAMGFLGALGEWKHWYISPLFAFILLEPVRGFWLWFIARRYQ